MSGSMHRKAIEPNISRSICMYTILWYDANCFQIQVSLAHVLCHETTRYCLCLFVFLHVMSYILCNSLSAKCLIARALWSTAILLFLLHPWVFTLRFTWSVEDCLCTCAFHLLCRPYAGECQAPCRHMQATFCQHQVTICPI